MAATSESTSGDRADSGRLRPRWSQIEGLRALAATCVFVLHAWVVLGMAFAAGNLILPSGMADSLLGGGLSKFLTVTVSHLGSLGVCVFYGISGFLLYQPFLRGRQSGEHLALAPYLIRRAARILPAYWIALTIIGLVEGSGTLFTRQGIVDYYLFGEIWTTLDIHHLSASAHHTGDATSLADTHAYRVIAGNPIQVAWTLCVEVSFYLFLPVWSWLVSHVVDRRRRPVAVEVSILLAVVAASLAWQVWVLSRVADVEFEPWLMILPSSIDIFAIGMILACLSTGVANGRQWPRALRSAGSTPALWWLAAAVVYLGLAFVESKYNPDPHRTWFVYFYDDFLRRQRIVQAFALAVLVFLILTPVVVGDRTRSPVARLLTWRITVWVGLVSYGLYIWHVWIIEKCSALLIDIAGPDSSITIGHRPRAWLFLPMALIAWLASLGVASASWHAIERRALAAAHRLSLLRRNA